MEDKKIDENKQETIKTVPKKVTKVEINGIEYKVLEDAVDSFLIEVDSQDDKGNSIKLKQWYFKSAVKVV